jgi:hypothetical protein
MHLLDPLVNMFILFLHQNLLAIPVGNSTGVLYVVLNAILQFFGLVGFPGATA